MSEIIVDVREKDEYLKAHIEGSVFMPLATFKTVAAVVLPRLEADKYIIMCQSGIRAQEALAIAKADERLKNLNFEVYGGGLNQWVCDRKPVVGDGGATLPVIRQVQLIVGLVIISSVLLSVFHWPQAIWVAALAGCGLFFAGLSGRCLLADVLLLCPWNKVNKCMASCCVAK
jgi:rhodanese-related sulfurtransferase